MSLWQRVSAAGLRAGLSAFAPLLVGLGAFTLYAQTFTFGLLSYDDTWLIGNNALLSDPGWKSLSTIFFDLSPVARMRLGGEYLPVRDLSILIDYKLWGRHFGLFHLSSATIYGVACGLLLLTLRRWLATKRLALLATLIFATHPLHVESVAWLSERKGLLAITCSFAALWAFHRCAIDPITTRRGRVALWLGAALSLVAAIWSKGLAVSTLGILAVLLLGRARPDPLGARAWRHWGGLALVAAGAFIPLWHTGKTMAMVGPYHGGGLGPTALLFAKAHTLYLAQSALVHPLAIAYPLSADSARAGALVFGALSLGVFIYISVRALLVPKPGKIRPWGVATGIWLCGLAPVSQIAFPLQNVAADRYLLLASLGWTIALALILDLQRSSRLLAITTIGLLLAQATLSVVQTRHWRDDVALYGHTLAVHPQHLPTLLKVAHLAAASGHGRRAERYLERAERIAPNDHRVLLRRALLVLKSGAAGAQEHAIALLTRAAQAPAAHSARANLALLSARRGRPKMALHWAEDCVRRAPLNHICQHALGVAALSAGELALAEDALRAALRLRPHYANAYYNLGVIAERRGHARAALDHYRKARSYNPSHPLAPGAIRRLMVDQPGAKDPP